MNYEDVITKMRGRHGLKSGQAVGVAGFHCKEAAISEAESDVEAVMTTVDVDLDDEVVLPSGADLSYFNATSQRKVFLDHCYDMASNVGVVRFINPFPNAEKPIGLKARIHIYRRMKDSRCDDLLERIKQGGMGMSVGFIPMEVGEPSRDEVVLYPKAESIVRRWKMLEVSFTSLPCNVRCQTLSTPEVVATPKTVVIERERRVIRI